MQYYVGLDVSLKQTSICVVDQAGLVAREGASNLRFTPQSRRQLSPLRRPFRANSELMHRSNADIALTK